MRARLWIVTALALAAAASSGADDSEPKTDLRRPDRVGLGLEFAMQAAMGSLSNPKIRSLAANDYADNEKAIQELLKRLRAESDRVLPSIDRLDALRAMYPQVRDLSRFDADRAALTSTIGDSCRTMVNGTNLLHELTQAQVSARLPAMLAKGTVPGSAIGLWGTYRTYEELTRIRERICGVVVGEYGAYTQRQQELQREHKRRVRLCWVGAAAAAAAAGAAWFFLRSRTSCERIY